MRRALVLVAGAICAATLTACGTIHDTIEPTAARAQPLSVELSAASEAGQVGVLAARSDGNMLRAEVNLSVRSPKSPSSPLADVRDGRVDVAIVAEPQLMLARNAGATVLGFGALTQKPSDSLIALRTKHIRSVADLKGRTVGTSGLSYEKGLLDAVLTRSHVPVGSVRQVDVGSDLAGALTSGRVAAAFGDNAAAIALRRDHRRIDVTRVSSLGVPTYSDLVFVTRETFFAQNVNLLRRFVQAVGRGYAAVRADPAAGAQVLRAADPSLPAGLATATVQATLPAMFPGDGEPWGWQNQHDWNVFGRWMTDRHLLRGPPAWFDASTNQLLAGQGP